MPVRKTCFPLQTTPIKEGSVLIGHPCGFIATASYLRRRPAKSRYVSNYLAGDAYTGGPKEVWNFASFAHEIETMQLEGCVLGKYAKAVLSKWVRQGRPAPWLARDAGVSDRVVSQLSAEDCVTANWVITR